MMSMDTLKIGGRFDYQDSARLIGLMILFGFEGYVQTKIVDYVQYHGYPLRHPKEGNRIKFSRDQWICLVAGLKVIFLEDHIFEYYEPENGDWMSPSHRNHVRICQGYPSSFVGNLWFWLDVLWSCFIAPMDEPNQLISMMMIHPNLSYLRFWTKYNKQWEAAIREYWCSKTSGIYDRGEPELAELMIETIKIRVFDTK